MITSYIVFNDTHIPFHDSKSLELIEFIIKEGSFDEVVINGDFLDAFNLNSHQPKDPEVVTSLEDEYDEGYRILKRIRKENPKKRIMYIFGNHEHRLDRFTVKNCPSFYNILTTEKMLRLEELDIKFIRYNDRYRIEKTSLYVQHSPPSYGENGARTSLMKHPNGSVIYGCTHRMQHSSITDINGKTHYVWFNGWLGSTDETEEHGRVFSYAKGHHNWQQCFCIIHVSNGKEFQVTQIPINKNGKKRWCVVNGDYYEV